MVSSKFFKIIFIFLLLLVHSCAYFTVTKKPTAEPATNVQLPAIFSDNLVMQQNKSCPVWGTADPGGEVTVQFADQVKRIIVPENGQWTVELSPQPVGGPYQLSIIGNDTIIFKNVMVGEVWVCSGQSNMEWAVKSAMNAEAEIAAANYPNIRLFTVKKNVSSEPLSDVQTDGWQICSPTTVPNFSAVAFFFGRQLNENLNIPIGLINTSWGGTPAEAWTSKRSLKKLSDFTDIIQAMESNPAKISLQSHNEEMKAYEEAFEKWKAVVVQSDRGIASGWHQPVLDDSQWETMPIPNFWEKQGLENYDGIVWYRKAVNIPESWSGQDITLNLGPINDVDVTWFNGVQVGTEIVFNKPRIYTIAASLVQAGHNVIAVRVFDYGGSGGMWGTADQYKLYSANRDSISLSGQWLYQTGVNLNEFAKQIKRPVSPQNRSTMLYNAMIAPLIPYAIRGAIWYQGESNAGRAYQYRTLFPTMIQDWRENWGQDDFPFLFVQLANFKPVKPEPADDDWAELREAQLMTLALPNTGMAVIIDIGEADDIHPKNKQDVGKRLALNARHLAYGEDIPYSGPLYQSMKIEGDKIRLHFDHVYDGLKVKGEKLTGFAIAGVDRKFYWADAIIDGETVVVSSPEVAEPVAVRYAWASNPICNLYNLADLPASPFRTDDWPGITEGKK